MTEAVEAYWQSRTARVTRLQLQHVLVYSTQLMSVRQIPNVVVAYTRVDHDIYQVDLAAPPPRRGAKTLMELVYTTAEFQAVHPVLTAFATVYDLTLTVVREPGYTRVTAPNPFRAIPDQLQFYRELAKVVTTNWYLVPQDAWPKAALIGHATDGIVSGWHAPSACLVWSDTTTPDRLQQAIEATPACEAIAVSLNTQALVIELVTLGGGTVVYMNAGMVYYRLPPGLVLVESAFQLRGHYRVEHGPTAARMFYAFADAYRGRFHGPYYVRVVAESGGTPASTWFSFPVDTYEHYHDFIAAVSTALVTTPPVIYSTVLPTHAVVRQVIVDHPDTRVIVAWDGAETYQYTVLTTHQLPPAAPLDRARLIAALDLLPDETTVAVSLEEFSDPTELSDDALALLVPSRHRAYHATVLGAIYNDPIDRSLLSRQLKCDAFYSRYNTVGVGLVAITNPKPPRQAQTLQYTVRELTPAFSAVTFISDLSCTETPVPTWVVDHPAFDALVDKMYWFPRSTQLYYTRYGCTANYYPSAEFATLLTWEPAEFDAYVEWLLSAPLPT